MKYHCLQMYIERNRARENNGKRGCGCCSTFVSSFMLTKKQCEKNLLYFLKLHGYRILSEEEAELWRTALEKSGSMDNPVSLRVAVLQKHSANVCNLIRANYIAARRHLLYRLTVFGALMDNAAFVRYISGKSIHIELSEESKTEYLEEWSADCRM